MKKIIRYDESKPKKRKWDVVLVLILLAVIIGGGAYIYLKNSDSSFEVDNSKNKPQSYEVGKEQDTFLIDNEHFSMMLEGKWEKSDGHIANGTYNYKTKDKYYVGRWIEIFIDTLPDEMGITKILPVTMEAGTIKPGVLSDQCRNFTKIDDVKITGNEPSKWEEIDFLCDVSKIKNITGTASQRDGHQVKFKTRDGEHSVYFRYTDHGTNPNNQIFERALETFKIKD